MRAVRDADIREHLLMLTPLAMTVWFMGDGGADDAGLDIQTHNFEFGEVERLVAALAARFGIRANTRANKGRWIIYGSSLRSWIASLGRRTAHPARVALQARTKERTNPVETARWTLFTRMRDMTQSDLVGNSERSLETVARQAEGLVSIPISDS